MRANPKTLRYCHLAAGICASICLGSVVTASASMYTDDISAQGPTAFWRFNDGNSASGQPAVSAVNNGTYQGTYTGSVSYSASLTQLDSGISAGNTSSYVVAPDTGLPTTGDRTIIAWIKTSAANGSGLERFFNYGSPTSTNETIVALGVNPNSSSTFDLQLFGAGTTFSIPSSTGISKLNDGNWHMAAISYSSNKWNAFIDGAPLGTLTASSNVDTGNGKVWIGNDGFGNGNNFNGSTADVAIYSKVLDSVGTSRTGTVTQLYADGVGARTNTGTSLVNFQFLGQHITNGSYGNSYSGDGLLGSGTPGKWNSIQVPHGNSSMAATGGYNTASNTSSGVTLAFSGFAGSDNILGINSNNTGTNLTDDYLLSANNSTSTITLGNLIAGHIYDVFFVADNGGGNVGASITYGSTTLTTTPGNQEPSAFALTRNGILFTNLSPDGLQQLTFTVNASNGNSVGVINGLQIVDTSVPEPASIGVLAIGAATILGARRRK